MCNSKGSVMCNSKGGFSEHRWRISKKGAKSKPEMLDLKYIGIGSQIRHQCT